MSMFPLIPGTEISLALLVFLGFALGIVAGFIGVGGGFLMTPALIILGFPAPLAVGTGLTWVMGNSIVGALRHRQLGNVDGKLGILIFVSVIGGIEVGVRTLNRLKDLGFADEAVLSVSICVLLAVGIYTFYETRHQKSRLDVLAGEKQEPLSGMKVMDISRLLQRMDLHPLIYFPKSGITISIWLVLIIGFIIGILAGFIGIGGGILLVPSLIYLIGLPSFTAGGTALFQSIFSAAFGSVRYTMGGDVVIFAALIMLLGSSVGTQLGALATRYVSGVSMRYVFALSMLVAVLGAVLKLIDVISDGTIIWLRTGTIGVTFGGLGLIVILIASLYVLAARYRNGKPVPSSTISLISKGF
jgi:uncharacterized membrane protein YfcA